MTTPRLTVDSITSDQLDELYARLARAEEGERRAKTRARHWLQRASRYSEAWMSARRGRRELRTRAEQAEAAIERVRDLHTEWLSTGAPPIGTSIARWWDKRLIELAAALDEPKEPTTSVCRVCEGTGTPIRDGGGNNETARDRRGGLITHPPQPCSACPPKEPTP